MDIASLLAVTLGLLFVGGLMVWLVSRSQRGPYDRGGTSSYGTYHNSARNAPDNPPSRPALKHTPPSLTEYEAFTKQYSGKQKSRSKPQPKARPQTPKPAKPPEPQVTQKKTPEAIIDSETYFEVNGKMYKSLTEMPEDVRKLFKDENGDGLPDFDILDSPQEVRNFFSSGKTQYTINGKNYSSYDELPDDVKEWMPDKDGDGFPDNIMVAKSDMAFDVDLPEDIQIDQLDLEKSAVWLDDVGDSKSFVKFNDKTYDSFDELPESIKKIFKDEDGDGLPDIFNKKA